MARGLTRPVTVPAATTASLCDLGIDRWDWPSVALPDTTVDQDACQGLHSTLHYQWEAVG